MHKTLVAPYSPRSMSARAIMRGLGVESATTGYTSSMDDRFTIINWGQPGLNFSKANVKRELNPASSTTYCIDKIKFLSRMASAEVSVPPWTTDKAVARDWIRKGKVVVARLETKGQGGDGIVFSDTGDMAQFLTARLFTEFIENYAEFRVHCAFGKIIDLQKKGLPYDFDKTGKDLRIRTHKIGFLYIKNGITVPQCVQDEALKAFKAMPGLDFGAVDVLWNRTFDKPYVLEINSAPGIEANVAPSYVAAFKEELGI